MSDFLFLMTPESLQAFVYIVVILVVFYVIMWVILKIVAHFKKKPDDVKKAQGLNLTLSSGADLATTSGLLSIDDNGNIFSMGFPKGMIIMWKPQSANLTPPVGWAVCDGKTPGVPDLTNKFIRGGTSTSAVNGVIGGADNVTLNVNHLPDHNHLLVPKANTKFHSIATAWQEIETDPGQGNGHLVTSAYDRYETGGIQNGTKNNSFDILPSYYTLVYLMKL